MEQKLHFKSSDFDMITVNRPHAKVFYDLDFLLQRPCGSSSTALWNAHVFYDLDFLRRHWGNYLRVVSVTPEAYAFQTAIVLEK
jgi:hypothetical protein